MPRRIVAFLLLGLFVVLFIGSCLITANGLQDDLQRVDLAVVLGSRVEPDGTPSPMLQARLDRTVELFRKGYFKLILVSGGLGKEGYSESGVMKHYLEAKGISSVAIIEDSTGSNTWRTAENTAQILDDRHLESVMIISQYFHVPRVRLAFAKFGVENISWSYARYWGWRDFYSVPREVIGYVAYWIRWQQRLPQLTTAAATIT
jgi:uncharacterized SAM-binding protein YcdF (DUF218 family)